MDIFSPVLTEQENNNYEFLFRYTQLGKPKQEVEIGKPRTEAFRLEQEQRAKILEPYQSKAKDISQLVVLGLEAYGTQIAKRMWQDHQNEITLNLCPKCHELARTNLAKQCRHCGYDWH